MNRQDMVEAGAKALVSWVYSKVIHWDELGEAEQGQRCEEVRTVLDAVLPQITDEEQIRALPQGSVLMSIENVPRFYRWYPPAGSDNGWLIAESNNYEDHAYLNEFLRDRDNVTLVWRPS